MAWRNLAADLVALFKEQQGDLEAALYRTYQYRLGGQRETRKLDHAARRARHRACKARQRMLTEQLKAMRAARPRVVIAPVGRPPELEAQIQSVRRKLLRALRRRKIATLAEKRRRVSLCA